jgi:hypothetical protein
MKELAFIIAIIAVIYFLNRGKKAPAVAAPSVVNHHTIGYVGDFFPQSIVTTQPIGIVAGGLNFSETAG